MVGWSSSHRLLKLGPALLLGAVALAGFLLFFGESVGGINWLLVVAVPLLFLVMISGLIATIIGIVGWSIRAPLHKLLWLGVAFTALGVLCSVLTGKMNFGFDDPSILFAMVPTAAAVIVGVLFLLAAGIRRWSPRKS